MYNCRQYKQTSLKAYQLMSLPRICVPENHSNYPPILIALPEIIPIYRRCDVTAPAASERLISKILVSIASK